MDKVKHTKKLKGQYYTVNCSYILEGFSGPPNNAHRVIEPFVGKGDLLKWIHTKKPNVDVECYDIDPKIEESIQRDTLLNPPSYKDAWILTNPPYLARNKCSDKTIFDLYKTNDLYKCFITSITQQEQCLGGILIIPAGFFLSPRNVDAECRRAFLSKYKLSKVKYFEEAVFPDTPTTIVAFAFERAFELLTEQTVEWESLPTRKTQFFRMCADDDWIIGGDIYKVDVPRGILIRRHVEGQQLKIGEQRTHITLKALDSGTERGRICLEYEEGYVYPAKESSRTYATLCISGRELTKDEQRLICSEFNKLLEKKREETWSLFLPQFRESKEYARKRIPFELAYAIVLHVIMKHLS